MIYSIIKINALVAQQEDFMSQETIGRYNILNQLGKGGMATVYRARDPHFDREVAVKVLPYDFLEDPQFRERFEREAKTIASLEHPAIVPVHDFGEDDGQPYLVMRLMTGGTLADRLQDGAMPPEEVGKIVNRIGSALDEAHKQGVIHRDLKPGNILFDQYGEAFLADFGIVRLAEGSATLTETGGTIGTPGYMSPEQIQGNEVDGRTDIYALGVITYEMLTGKAPFAADSPAMVIVKQMTEEPPSARDLRPDLSEDTDTVLRRTMSKQRNDRPDTAQELSEMLAAATKMTQQAQEMLAQVAKAINGSSSTEESEPGLARPTSFFSSRQWLWAAGLILLLVVAGAFFLFRPQDGDNGDVAIDEMVPTATAVENIGVPVAEVELADTAVTLTSTPIPIDQKTIQDTIAAAWTYFETGQYDSAIAAADDILDLVDNADAYHIRGLAYRQAGDIEQALADLGKAAELDSQNSQYWLDLSNTYPFSAEYYADALQAADNCVQIDNENAECHGARGAAFIRISDYESALTAYNLAIALAPTLPHMYGQRQDVQRELGFVDEALADSTKAIELLPDYAQFYGDRAYTYLFFMDGQSEKARVDAEQCAVLQPDLALCYYTLGVALRQQEKFSIAATSFTTFLELVALDDAPDWQANANAFLTDYWETAGDWVGQGWHVTNGECAGDNVDGTVMASSPSICYMQFEETGTFSLLATNVVTGQLYLPSSSSNKVPSINLYMVTYDEEGNYWESGCTILRQVGSDQAETFCKVETGQLDTDAYDAYFVGGPDVDYGTWYSVRIEVDPITGENRFYLDGRLVGNYVPPNAEALLASPFNVEIQLHSGGSGEVMVGGQVQNVEIGSGFMVLPGVETGSLDRMQPQIPWLPADAAATGSYLYYFRTDTPPFDNLQVRQALVTAVDREAIAELARSMDYQDVLPATTFAHPAMLGRDLYGDVGLAYDPTQARTLLAAAGYENGSSFPTITIVTNPATVGERHTAIAEAVAQMWRDVLSIPVEVKVLDVSFADYVKHVSIADPGLYRFGYAPDEDAGNDPFSHFLEWLGTGGSLNFSDFSSFGLDAILDAAQVNADNVVTRQQYYIEADRVVTEKETAVLPLFHYMQQQ
jgi:serine/threonine protein kinase/tetratricopeptide (TPR) repeat protein